MNKNILNKIFKNRELNILLGKIIMYTLGISSYILFQFYFVADGGDNPEIFKIALKIYLLINLPLILFYLTVIIIEVFRISLNNESKLIIIYNFLKSHDLSDDQFLNKFVTLFPKISRKKLTKFLIFLNKQEISIYRSCGILSGKSAKERLFLIYTLFDLAASDQLYSMKEEEFIKEVSNHIHIPKKSYLYIKQAFIKKGLQEERKIIDEQNRKKLAESFLPYNAYKILGVTPTVTKAQLKKIYRKLAKKYHPDKFYGQSEKVIQQAEDKFQGITEAYEIILKHKQF